MGKTLKIILFALIVCSFMQMPVQAAYMTSIEEVLIVPEEPLYSDIITIVSSGTIQWTGIPIEKTIFLQEENLLELEIYFKFPEIATPVVTTWEHSEEIGTLLNGDYDLIVHTFYTEGSNTSHEDMYITDFTVVPEPTTITMFVFGMLGIWRRKSK